MIPMTQAIGSMRKTPVFINIKSVKFTKQNIDKREVRRRDILNIFNEGARLTSLQVAKLLSVSNSTTRLELRGMAEQGSILFNKVKINRGGKGFYERVYFD